jgi:hypothetical protein
VRYFLGVRVKLQQVFTLYMYKCTSTTVVHTGRIPALYNADILPVYTKVVYGYGAGLCIFASFCGTFLHSLVWFPTASSHS